MKSTLKIIAINCDGYEKVIYDADGRQVGKNDSRLSPGYCLDLSKFKEAIEFKVQMIDESAVPPKILASFTIAGYPLVKADL